MKTKKYLISLLIISFAFLGFGQDTSEFFEGADAFFKSNVTNGKVAYKKVKNDSGELHRLLEMAEKLTVSKENAKAYQAFWINSYNLLVIKGIVDHYPVKQPLDIAGFFDKTKHSVGGTEITLNDIENKMLRAEFSNEARFHFVLVCAGLGCPPIINEAYLPSTLEAQLQRQTVAAINNADFIRVNKNKVQISQIFEWYKGDFEKNGSVTDFINTYRSEKLPEKSKVSYYSYDWTLNDAK
ncbi:DUF547 domain-containing protein [Maribacter sp. 2-571]|uniref:DUF547 domain-containing protein n=1 Tax=Maribacter sp. 2-571 TaxID=3417569 RepID=UPI003D34715D